MSFKYVDWDKHTERYLNEIKYNCELSIQEIGKSCWDIDTRRQRKRPGYQQHTKTIRLMSWDLDNANSWDTTFETKPIPPYPDRWPDIADWLERFEHDHQREVLTASYVMLDYNMPVYEHTDSAPFYHATDRYHFVLQGRYDMIVDDMHHLCAEGDVIWFDGQKPHSVQNYNEERIALIFDVM